MVYVVKITLEGRTSMQTDFLSKIRNSKTTVVGAAYKIAAVEAVNGEITEDERAALAKRHTWETHRDEIIELLEGMRTTHLAA